MNQKEYVNTQLPILMSWVIPDREILPKPSTHTAQLDAVMVVDSRKLSRKYRTNLWCAYPVRYPLAHSDFLSLSFDMLAIIKT